MNVYTQKADYLGRVEEVIRNLERGEVMQLSLKPLTGGVSLDSDVKKILKEHTISFSDVINVGDIILVARSSRTENKSSLRAL
jgi:sporulation protein YlmC with PRC-barrel domain